MRRKKRHFSDEVKRQAVNEYLSGKKSAAELAIEHDIAQGLIYKWKTYFEEQAKGVRVEELEAQGHHPQDIKKIIQQEEEIALYKAKLAETTLHNDLLKKLLEPHFPLLKSANGLEEIKRALDQSKRRVK